MNEVICLQLDRTRTVFYNGNELLMNTFKCSSCKGLYIMDEVAQHKFCPLCGSKYDKKEDISF